ncbi:sigma-54-dependent transcriptional regulator [Alienimonas californiensis]|uniref:DNA-binding transcriptional response regulator n=1 Tax=Alienimonas californiensis TaxID=2527989 RepID=A0A517PCM3_9PLAN|nr:sigma-54 dependent transcriptional regulator [Alienimonas californiensis]QDT17129.1 DNA-binding transcriptional response regulator [Alienimonas californiensis]
MPDSPPDDDLSGVPIRVLIVDDDKAHAETVADVLDPVGCECTVAAGGKAGVAAVAAEVYDVVVTDLKMEGADGLKVLERTKEELPDAEVIVVTGYGTVDSAVDAMQRDAFTYLAKPLDVARLRAAVAQAAKRIRLARKNAELSRRLDERFGFEGVVGTSGPMRQVIEVLRNVAPTDSTVLITGESGTGKELVARALHQNSPRKNKPFVSLNVAALPKDILESELFGHEAGAFTGASSKRIGKFEYANGGTLFLDEVGEMPADIQVKLLRVLEDRKVTRLGSNAEIPINVRLLAATNADLLGMVTDKAFREDLYYRLNVISIRLPPLRDRRGDIPLLLDYFLRDLTERYGKDVVGFTRRARTALMSYEWPGNIRQLRNVVERMVVLDTDGLLDAGDLPEEVAGLAPEEGDDAVAARGAGGGSDHLIGRPLAEVERFYAERALEVTGGKREDAAKLLGIGERTLYRKLKEWGLN